MNYTQLIFELSKPGRRGHTIPECDVPERPVEELLGRNHLRRNAAPLPEVAENEVVRHFVALSQLNHNVDKGFYPLGSCTMKYNPKINERLAANSGFAALHPDLPEQFVQGALQIMYELQQDLLEITGFTAITLQPAAGAQGEFVGLLLMQQYHRNKGRDRKTILIPDSAHGTNPASAAIAGFKTVTVASNPGGMIDLTDLQSKINDDVAGLMLTNPNTLGIFEKQIPQIRQALDTVDALFYMDGANMNALFGIVRPGDLGFDVMHLNLHKSFSTPHGGGGPGSGPVAVNEKLSEFLPGATVEFNDGFYYFSDNGEKSIGEIHSFYGNFALLLRAYVYIRSVGAKGFRKVAESAIINANYLLARLKEYYDPGYQGVTMHEFVLSAEKQKQRGIKALDIAKRLLDFGVHPPTVYFPLIVKEAMMIEPTETESKESLDYFADAMIQIDREID